MTVVFTKTAKSSAKGSFIGALIVGAIGGLFICMPLLAGDLPTYVKVILISVGVLCLVWGRSLVREGRKYLKSGRDWRVEITDRKLSWQSPVQEIMASFEVPFSNIRTLRHVRTRRGNKGGFWEKYTIELHQGDTIKVSDQVSGIEPSKVFASLAEKGVSLETEVVATRKQFREKHQKRLNEKRSVRAGRRMKTAVVATR